MNIYEKLLAITNELQTVKKNLNVSTGSGTYKAVSERDVLDAVKPLEVKYKVYSFPAERTIEESQLIEKTNKYGTTTQLMSRIKTVYKFVNIEKPEECITTVTFAEGIDSQDKGSGKAMTYADKYALMKAYKISTGEDPDQEASKDGFMKPKINLTNRQKLVEFVKKNNLDFEEIANKYSLNKNSTEAEYGKVLAELEILNEDKGGIF